MILTKRHYLIIGATLLAALLTLSAATLKGSGNDPMTVPERTMTPPARPLRSVFTVYPLSLPGPVAAPARP